MIVARMESADRAAVEDILRACDVELDLSDELSRPWARLWVARPSALSEPVGFLLAWSVADELHILQVATRPDMRRRGAGGTLLDAAIAHAREQGARILLLEVRKTNDDAIRMYRSRGFHVIRVRRGYYARDGEDALEMMLDMNPESGSGTPDHGSPSPSKS